LMLPTLIIWIIALILGYIIYLLQLFWATFVTKHKLSRKKANDTNKV
jgi:uncharacterized membrane protein